MLTITYARNQRGWSPCDHMLDDGPLMALVGRTYRTLAGLLRAARQAEDRDAYARVEYIDSETGERWEIGTEPNLPGRQSLYRSMDAPTANHPTMLQQRGRDACQPHSPWTADGGNS